MQSSVSRERTFSRQSNHVAIDDSSEGIRQDGQDWQDKMLAFILSIVLILSKWGGDREREVPFTCRFIPMETDAVELTQEAHTDYVRSKKDGLEVHPTNRKLPSGKDHAPFFG